MSKKQSAVPRLSAVSAAFVEHSTFLKRFLTRYFSSRQDIEDVAQETYLRAYVEEQKKGVNHPKAFLFHVAKNVALSKLTKKSRQITDYLEDFPLLDESETEASIDSHLEAEELLGVYCEAVASLPDRCREAFILRKVHGLAHKEIMERMSLSRSGVDKYVRIGMATCDKFIRESEGRRSLTQVGTGASAARKTPS